MELQTLQVETNISTDRPFTGDYLLYLLAQASAAASNSFHADLAALGVSVPKWRILASLHPLGRMTIGQLAKECLQKQPTLTRIVDRLEQDGLVRRSHSLSDRREVRVSLTDKGRELTASLVARARHHEAAILDNYSNDEVEVLKETLRELVRRTSSAD